MVPARRRPAADGRALRPRRPRHPGHRHPCLPPLRPLVRLPHTWRPFGVRIAAVVFGGMLLVGLRRSPGSRFDEETRAPVHPLPARHAGLPRPAGSPPGYALVRSRVVARPRRLTVVNGYRRRELRVGRDGRACTCRRAPRGPRSTSPTAPPRPRWPSRAPTATAPAGPSASSARSPTAPTSPSRRRWAAQTRRVGADGPPEPAESAQMGRRRCRAGSCPSRPGLTATYSERREPPGRRPENAEFPRSGSRPDPAGEVGYPSRTAPSWSLGVSSAR